MATRRASAGRCWPPPTSAFASGPGRRWPGRSAAGTASAPFAASHCTPRRPSRRGAGGRCDCGEGQAVSELRVVHLAKFYPPATGGIETHLETLARAQSALGLAVRVICVNHLDKDGLDVTW